ncbi:sialidase family protein [Myxococcus virescens]|uniref:sialidase family protein n=1 Tax=Myxococcus virescens TaxID=83456 RepID=UPI003DA3F7D5
MTRLRIVVFASVAALAGSSCKKEASPRISELVFEPEPQKLLATPAKEPHLVVRASGDTFALLVRPVEGGGADLVLVNSGDGGDHFGAPTVINTTPGEVRSHSGGSPRLLLGPRSEFYAVWLGDEALRVAKSTTYGRSFGPPVDVPMGEEGAPSFFNAEIAPDGTLLIAWIGGVTGKTPSPGTSFVSVAATRDGTRFEVFPGVGNAVCPCCRPALAADGNGQWFLSYRATREGIRDIVVQSSQDRGKNWAPRVPVSDDGWRINGCPHSGPALALAGEKLHVAWYSEAEGTPRLYWTRSPVEELAFEPRRRLSNTLLDANQPSLAVQGDAVYAAFQGRDAEAREGWAPVGVYVRRLSDEASPPLLVPGGRGSAAFPELKSLGAGKWMVVWTDRDKTFTAMAARARQRD